MESESSSDSEFFDAVADEDYSDDNQRNVSSPEYELCHEGENFPKNVGEQQDSVTALESQGPSITDEKTEIGAEQCMLLYDASQTGTVMQKISKDQPINLIFNIQNCHPEAGAQMSFGPTLIQEGSTSDLQNEMDFLQDYRADFQELFVPTVAFTDSVGVLGKHHALVVTGAPGSGKTFISQQLLLKFCDEEQCNPFQPTLPEEYLKWCNIRQRQAFLMDDVFGASNFNQSKYDAWVNVFPKMVQHLRSLNTFLIFICRYNVLKPHLHSLRKFDFLKNIINLSDEKYQLTEENKIDLFESHSSKFNTKIKINEVNLTAQKPWESGNEISPIGFPQCVRLFCSMKNVSKESKLKYFHCPMDFLSNVVGSFWEGDRLSYCVLILLLINDGRLLVNKLHPASKPTDEVIWSLRVSRLKESKATCLREAADNLCGSLLLLDNDSFVYQHPSIMEAVTLDFGKKYPSDILDRCSIPFLVERVFTHNSSPADNEFVVVLQPVMFAQLCERILKEIKSYFDFSTHLIPLSSYAVFKDDAFTRVLLRHLRKTDAFHVLFTSLSAPDDHRTFMFLAAANGQNAFIQKVFTSFLQDVQHLPGFSDQLDRVLYAACSSGSADAVRALLAAGAGADYRAAPVPVELCRCDDWFNLTCTTLMHAAYSSNVEVLHLICDRLQQQVDLVEYLGIKNCEHKTALHLWATRAHESEALKLPKDKGADLNVHDDAGFTSLHWSTAKGDKEAAQLLVRAGADVNATCAREHKPALHWWAAGAHGSDALQLLKEKGADLNVQDDAGCTSLHWSTAEGDKEAAQLLVRAGADVNATCTRGRTALYVSAEHGRVDIARLLVEAGADVQVRASASPRNKLKRTGPDHSGKGDLAFFTRSMDIRAEMYLKDPMWCVTALEIAVIYQQKVVANFLQSVMQMYAADTLRRCSDLFLLEYVLTRQSDKPYAIIIQPDMFPQLCIRLVTGITVLAKMHNDTQQDMGFATWFQDGNTPSSDAPTAFYLYPVFRDVEFTRVFLRHMQQTDMFHILFESLYVASEHPTFLFLAAIWAQDVLIREIFSSYLQDIQRLPGFADHLDAILYAACSSGSTEAVRALLAAGARADYRTAHDPNDVSRSLWNSATSTTLMHAAYSDEIEVLNLIWGRLKQQQGNLVEHLCISDEVNGMTALHWWAARGGKIPALQLFLECGADVNARTGKGQTALHWAADHKDETACRMLLAAGANVNAANSEGKTVLCLAACRGTESLILLLLESGADVNASSIDGKTALHLAVSESNEAAVKLMLQTGADANARDKWGRAALHISAEHGDDAIARLLVEAGADLHIKGTSQPSTYTYNSLFLIRTYSDLTPLEVAVMYQHSAVEDVIRSRLA